MVVDLNKKLVSKEGLLKHIQDIDVYRLYTNQEILLKKPIVSPLGNDNNPSFGYFESDSGEICFNDYRIGGGDFIRFVELKFGLNYFEALSKIATDMNLKDKFYVKPMDSIKKKYDPDKYTSRDLLLSKTNNFQLGKKVREYTMKDLAYWMQFGIDYDTLTRYNVEPLQYIFIQGKPVLADKYAYSFSEFKDRKQTLKIYQPFNEDYKWLNSHNSSVWQGWLQMPAKNDKLIITKSLKDVMSIVNIMNIPAISLQSESTRPKPHIIDQLKRRFEDIYILYDNDYDKEVNWGRQFSEELSDMYNLRFIEIDEQFKSKDFSDLVKNKDKKMAKEILNDMIINYLPF